MTAKIYNLEDEKIKRRSQELFNGYLDGSVETILFMRVENVEQLPMPDEALKQILESPGIELSTKDE